MMASVRRRSPVLHEQMHWIVSETVVDYGWRDTMDKLMVMGVATWQY